MLYWSDCSATKSEDIVEFLRSQSLETLTKTLTPADNFRPVIDDDLLKADNIVSCKNDNLSAMDVIFGSNNSEGAIFTYVFCRFQVPNKEFCRVAVQKSLQWAYNEDKTDTEGFTDAVMQEYFGRLDENDAEGLLKAYVELMGDLVFVFPTCVATQAHCSEYFHVVPSQHACPTQSQSCKYLHTFVPLTYIQSQLFQ